MSRQSGNFLLQALLALSLVFAFIPFLASHLATQEVDTQMYSATRSADIASTAARIFVRENANNIMYGRTVIAGAEFADTLEPYGLPLGFVARNALGMDMVLVINKTADDITAWLELTGGNLSGLRRAELVRRIGFYAENRDDMIVVGVPLDVSFSDVVRRNEPDIDSTAFLTDLDMGGYVFDNAGVVVARRATFDSAAISSLTITGMENGRKIRNNIAQIFADRAVFQSGQSGESALLLKRGALQTGSLDLRTIAMYGDTGTFTAPTASAYEFSMTAGRSGFTGPHTWNIHGNVVTTKINFSVERMDVSSYMNISRGQDVYIESDELDYASRSGIETTILRASNVTMRDQTSTSLNSGGHGDILVDIRPAGTSMLPDAQLDTIDNANFKILSSPSGDSKTVDCRSIINSLGQTYNQHSISQYIICQYVFWHRLEQRIDIKQCLMDGGNDCM
ncbi:hypothetical protein HDR66_03385 [bacterium]|nr:hypothetical protein [bacterium]